jgi:isoquinoline 1-oxidoreductase subunit beta
MDIGTRNRKMHIEALALEPSNQHQLVVSSRRSFLKVTALVGGGMMLSVTLPSESTQSSSAVPVQPLVARHAITAWVRISTDNTVTIIISQAEIGQGISTTLPAIVADELGADWARVKLETAPFSTAYRNPRLNFMFTGNSESTQAFYELMRQAGAAVRTMLVHVAAARWGVPAGECITESSTIVHRVSGQKFNFGDVAEEAAKLSVPQSPTLKSKDELTLVGRSLPRVDIPSKVDGSAVFGIDFQVPNMLTGAVRRAPTFAGALTSVNEAAIKLLPGVRAVVKLNDGVVVLADTYLQARRALLKYPPEFTQGPHTAIDTASLRADYLARLNNGPWTTALNKGDAAKALQVAKHVVSFDYENPFAAHATMEPMNCIASVTEDRCEIWAPTQGQELAHTALKTIFKLKDAQVIVNRTPAIGGGFGRRLLPDFVVQAAVVSKAVGRPVKLIWDREEDMLHDYFRPATAVRMSAVLNNKGMPTAVASSVVSPTILLPVFPPIEAMLKGKGIDPSALEGMLETEYDLPERRVDFHLLKTPIPTSVMRTTGYGPNIFALESFIDELALAARKDPYRYRRLLLSKSPRALKVLDRVAAIANWNAPLPKSTGRGIAYAHAFGTHIAQVVEAQVVKDAVRVKTIHTVVDCGSVLDPMIAAAGIEGGIVFGLAYCKAEITFKGGRPEQDNLHTYQLPYLAETPLMVTEFIENSEKLGGIGEVSPVTVSPALANAIFSASGKRLRAMPLARFGMRFA